MTADYRHISAKPYGAIMRYDRTAFGTDPLWPRATMHQPRMPDEHIALVGDEAFRSEALHFDFPLKKRRQ